MAKKKSVKSELKFYQKLILNRYLLRKFGAEKFEDLAKILKAPLFEELLADGSSGYYKVFMEHFHDKMEIPDYKLQEYDLNIVSHLNKINEKRTDKIKLKYFQYLSLLFIEYYLDMFFHAKDQLLAELNEFREQFASEYLDIISIEPYKAEDLNKVALWNATGSGKTLLMHINYLQYLHYAGEIGEGDTFILLTPKEGLSRQHLADFAESGIPAEIFDKNASRGSLLFNKNAIQILENTKLAKKDGRDTVAASRFGSHNVVFVDEGHRGASGDTWYTYRNELCKDGFSFEYSATFGQAIAASNDPELESEYAKCIIFDYSYKYFYSDGYGKDYNIINLQDDEHSELRSLYLTACLLTYYQQKRLFLDKKDEFGPYNIENPLMVFVASSVNAVSTTNGRETSDVVDILLFLSEFVKEKEASVNYIKRVMDHTTGIVDAMNRDVFRNAFSYLTSLSMKPEDIFSDLIKIVFNCNTNSSLLHIENLKGVQGEISLRLGENEPFGLINVGDDAKLLKLCEASGFATSSIDFKQSFFDTIAQKESKLNILIGSKKFTEGWNCWRVSTMGLLNVGRSEGSEIIQMFGRGVRLKGYAMSLMRSHEYSKLYTKNHLIPPAYIGLLETLNVFGVRADYMKRFKEYLEKEGVPTQKDAPYVISMPIIRNRKYKARRLYSLQIKDGLDYKRDARKPFLEFKEGIKVELDCYGKVQFETSRERNDDGLVKETGYLKPEHFAMLDRQKLFFAMERYKAEKLRYNLIITQEGIESLLSSHAWYTLYIPSAELKITSFKDYEKFERIIVSLLKAYCDKLYNIIRSAWENDHMEYKVVDDTYENFIEDNEYTIAINDEEPNQELIAFVEELKAKVAEAKAARQLIDYSSPEVKGSFELFSFAGSLYNPLLYVKRGEKEIVISPVALVESEKRFVLDLDAYLKAHAAEYADKEVYLIRNKAKKGVGFFETAGFYPDFIMWIVDGNKQYMTFIEPHGMVHETIASEKVQLHKKIKGIQEKLGSQDVILNSIILSESSHYDLIDHHEESEWNENNVFFMDSADYIEKMMKTIK